MNDVYKDQDKSWQNSSQALNVELNDSTAKQSEEEPSEVPIGLDPSRSSYLCPWCGATCLDLGKQQPDQYSRERRWLKCSESGCRYLGSLITGPARILPSKPDFRALKRAGLV